MAYDDLNPLNMEDHGRSEILFQRATAPKLFRAGSKIRMFRYNTDVYVEVSTPVMLTVRGGRKGGRISLLSKLDPLVAAEVPPDDELSGVELGATTSRLATWWAGVKPKIQEAFVKVVRSPVTALLTGVSLFVSGWGLVYASAYLGARAALAIAGPPRPGKATLPAIPAKVSGFEIGAVARGRKTVAEKGYEDFTGLPSRPKKSDVAKYYTKARAILSEYGTLENLYNHPGPAAAYKRFMDLSMNAMTRGK